MHFRAGLPMNCHSLSSSAVFFRFIAPVLVLALTTLVGCRSVSPPEADLTIEARDFAFRAPRVIGPGRTTIRLRNFGPSYHHAVLLRLDSPDSADAVIARLQNRANDSDGPVPGATSIGGPEGHMPSGDSYVTVDVEPGEYLIVCTIPEPGGVPHVARGMYRRLTVRPWSGAGPMREPPLAEPDMVIRATDYAYTLTTDRLESGWRTIRFHNAGAVEHIAEIAALKPGKTAAGIRDWIRKGFHPADNPKTTIGGSTRLAPGRFDDIHIYLRPGRYVVFCMLHVPGGPAHVLVGMAKEFVVD